MNWNSCFVSSLALSLAGIACGGRLSTPVTKDDGAHYFAGGLDSDCAVHPPSPLGCGPCADGYRVEDGGVTCACCSESTRVDAGGGATPSRDAGPNQAACCDPATRPAGGIEGVYCCADGWRPSPAGGWRDTCAPHGGKGVICGEEPEVCGEGPPEAACECPFGGYKQKGGKPTCECCTF